jgi:hypothetical protein
MLRVMLDSMIRNRLQGDPAANALLDHHVAAGTLVLVETHVQGDEVAKISDDVKRTTLENVVSTTREPGVVFSLDVSRLDEDTFGSDENHRIFDAVRNDNPKHSEDAVISATAAATCDAFVCDDKQTRNKVRRALPSFTVWSWPEFRDRLVAGRF